MTYDGPPSRPQLRSVETDHDHAPPQSITAEQAVLGALLLVPDLTADLLPHLEPDDFYVPKHETLWAAIAHLYANDGAPPDHLALAQHLTTTGQMPHIGGAPYLHDLMAAMPIPGMPTIHDATRWARAVRDTRRLRDFDATAGRVRQLVRTSTPETVERYLGDALQVLDDTVSRFGPRDLRMLGTGLADLTWVGTTGEAPPSPQPTYGRRNDGTALFYKGRVNGLFGDPECGKTWLAQIAIVEALNTTTETVAMIDVDHNGQDHTAGRLLRLGARPHVIADPTRFRYYEPEDADQLLAAIADITRLVPDVVLLDSIGEILPMMGVKSVDNDEVTAALRRVAMPPAKAGSCVITIDHLPKSAEARSTGYAIGGTAKKRAMDGAYIRCEARQQPTPGGVGRVTLRIEKDRTGQLRASSGGGYAGTFVLDSTQPHTTTWDIGRETAPTNPDGTFRPTSLMEKVARYIADHDGCTQRDIETDIPGTSKYIRQAIQVLVTEGHVTRTQGANRRMHHTLTIPYREAEDDHAQPTL